MLIPIRSLPDSPAFPGISFIKAIPPGVVPEWIADLSRLNLPFHGSFPEAVDIPADDIPVLEVEFAKDKLSSSLSFITRKVGDIPVDASWIVADDAGLLLIPAVPPHVGKAEISRSTANPGSGHAAFLVKVSIPALPVRLFSV